MNDVQDGDLCAHRQVVRCPPTAGRLKPKANDPRSVAMNTASAAKPILAACPQCHAVVRVPSDRSDDHPKCPRCKSELLKGEPVALDKTSFPTYIEGTSLPVLVDFWAPWCGPCLMMAPVLDRAAHERASTLQVAKVNTDEQQELAGRFGIRSIPTLILFRDGREIARQSGALDGGTLTRWLDSALAQ